MSHAQGRFARLYIPAMDSFEPASLNEWDTWLNENGQRSASIWLVLGKQGSGLPVLDRTELIKTALTHGWIDSLPNKIDARRYKLRFSPRNPRSNWSAVNKAYIAELEAAERMQPAGKAMVDLAKQTGTWTALDNVDALVVEGDLAAAFAKTPGSRAQWEAFPRSVKRGQLEQIYTAKRPATRAKRIAEVVSKAAIGERAFAWDGPKS